MSWVKNGVKLMKWLRDTNAIVRIVALLLCVTIMSTVYVGEAQTVSTEPMHSKQTISSGDAVIDAQTEDLSDDETEAAEGGGGTAVSSGDVQQTVSSGDVQMTYGIAPRVTAIPGGTVETEWKLYARATGPVGVTLTYGGTTIELGTSSEYLGYELETYSVTIGVAVESGYEIASITAGSAEVTDNGDGTYTFKMPTNETEIVIETKEIVPATFTITQKGYTSRITVYAPSGTYIFASSPDSTDYKWSVETSGSAVYYLRDSDNYFGSVAINNVPATGEIGSVTLYVDGVKNESALVKNSSTSYSFAPDFCLPKGASAELVVEYDAWNTVTVNQTDTSENKLLGSTTVNAAGSSSPFWGDPYSGYQTAGTSGDSASCMVRPGTQLTTVVVEPSNIHVITDIKIYAIDEDGNRAPIDFTLPVPYNPAARSVFNLNYIVPANTDIVV
ncbi:MAG: hypothetical protein J6L81_10905, partial [Clostridia bacterium]|nr:hypothetical protein [Clostridia bacterium]